MIGSMIGQFQKKPSKTLFKNHPFLVPFDSKNAQPSQPGTNRLPSFRHVAISPPMRRSIHIFKDTLLGLGHCSAIWKGENGMGSMILAI